MIRFGMGNNLSRELLNKLGNKSTKIQAIAIAGNPLLSGLPAITRHQRGVRQDTIRLLCDSEVKAEADFPVHLPGNRPQRPFRPLPGIDNLPGVYERLA